MKRQPDEQHAQVEDAYRAAYLVTGYLKKTLTTAEKDELDEWVLRSEENMKLFAELTDERYLRENLEKMEEMNRYLLYEDAFETDDLKRETKHVRNAGIIALAASILLLLGAFLVYRFIQKHPAKKMETGNAQVSDIGPGSNKATLDMGNGKRITLDSVPAEIIRDGDLKVINENGSLNYAGEMEGMAWHTLSTPRGGQYHLILPDGTQVWLNAESSIRYPVAFTAKDRVVEFSGEAYFEVSSMKDKPFLIKMKDENLIQVLGTHFNIRSYPDEPNLASTLLEGTILLHSPKTEIIMSPGQRSVINKQGEIETTTMVDPSEAIAWKNGEFRFIDASIEEIMNQVQRWYDVEVVYESRPEHHFNATVSRNTPVSKLFRYLELTRHVKFRIEDKRIVVTR